MSVLSRERKTFNKNRALLFALVPEQHVLIKGKEIICARESRQEAVDVGRSLYGSGEPFFVKQVFEVDHVLSI